MFKYKFLIVISLILIFFGFLTVGFILSTIAIVAGLIHEYMFYQD